MTSQCTSHKCHKQKWNKSVKSQEHSPNNCSSRMLKHAVFYFLFGFLYHPLVAVVWKSPPLTIGVFRWWSSSPAGAKSGKSAAVESGGGGGTEPTTPQRRQVNLRDLLMATRNPVFTHQLREVGSWIPVIYRFFLMLFFLNTVHPRWLLWDFWTINRIFDSNLRQPNGVLVSHAWRLLDVGSNIHGFLGGGWISHPYLKNMRSSQIDDIIFTYR